MDHIKSNNIFIEKVTEYKKQKGGGKVAEIDAKGMQAADLSAEQLAELRQAEQKLNNATNNKQEVYLLAVSR